jgi:hypothetical protein
MRGRTGALALLLVAGTAHTARAAEEKNPVSAFGIRLVDDLKLKWSDTLPEFSSFSPDEGSTWDPWALADADASLARQTGRLKLGLGVGRLGWRVDSTTIVEGTAARVKIRLGLDLGAGRLLLRLPDVKVTPHFDKGQLGFDWVVPIIEERF